MFLYMTISHHFILKQLPYGRCCKLPGGAPHISSHGYETPFIMHLIASVHYVDICSNVLLRSCTSSNPIYCWEGIESLNWLKNVSNFLSYNRSFHGYCFPIKRCLIHQLTCKEESTNIFPLSSRSTMSKRLSYF